MIRYLIVPIKYIFLCVFLWICQLVLIPIVLLFLQTCLDSQMMIDRMDGRKVSGKWNDHLYTFQIQYMLDVVYVGSVCRYLQRLEQDPLIFWQTTCICIASSVYFSIIENRTIVQIIPYILSWFGIAIFMEYFIYPQYA